MSNEESARDGARLAELLREGRRRFPLPAGFQRGVWRRIEQEAISGTVPGAFWVGWLAEALLRPRLAMTGIITMLVAGTLFGVLDGVGNAHQTAQARYVEAVAPFTLR